MADETSITIRGRLTADPNLRFVQSGAPVVNFDVATNSRRFNKQTNEWEDSETTFYPVSLWGTGAENVAETLRKGQMVIVSGHIGSRSWEAEGQKRTRMEVKALAVGLDLTWVQVKPENVIRSTGKSSGQDTQAQQSAPQGGSAGDPWAVSPSQAGSPPF